jgi:hypothetical protein
VGVARWAAALAFAGVVLSACSTSHHAAAPVPPSPTGPVTIQKTYSPYAAAGTLVVPVAATQPSGSCWTTSIAVPRAGVYRCLIANSIADPCFAPDTSSPDSVVACATDPWHPATLVHLTAALPVTVPQGGDREPWALELAGGLHCVLSTGTVPKVDGVELNYLCGESAGAGQLTTAGALQTVEYGSLSGPTVGLVDVVTAWRS